MDKHSVLKQYFGHTGFRPGQLDIIDAVQMGRDVLGIMPTGAGKSICYQVPALLLDGLTIVVSPLISLMQDQVAALEQNGVKAAFINSSLSPQQYGDVFRLAGRNAYRILYVAPERLLTNDFLALSRQVRIAMVTVDEAHCISQWGQDFRPSYLKVAQFIASLPQRPVVSAFTATATHEVRDDIVALLHMQAPLRVITGFDRPNLHFAVQQPEDKDVALREIIARHKQRSGIVYCATRKAVEAVYADLMHRHISVTRYHAGLDDQERHQNQDDFIYDRKLIMVATNAFGMGIDKSNVAYVVHYNMPKNLESYYQEAGRAGRDGEPAECTLLYGKQDIRTCRYLIEHGNENQEMTDLQRQLVMAKDLERLKTMINYCVTSSCLRACMLEYFGEPAKPHCGACSNCQTTFDEIDITREAKAIVTCVNRMAQRSLYFGKTVLVDVLTGSNNEKIRKYRLNELASYGQLTGTSRRRIDAMLDCLFEQRYLRTTDDQYPVVQLTPNANSLINGSAKLILRLAAEKPAASRMPFAKPAAAKLPSRRSVSDRKAGSAKAGQPGAAVAGSAEAGWPGGECDRLGGGKDSPSIGRDDFADSDDSELLALLKQVRRTESAHERVPAYLIFSDNTLRDLCQKLPLTKAAFLGVSGVGATKAEKYWLPFTTVIRTYMEAHGYKRVQQLKPQADPREAGAPPAGATRAAAGSGDESWTPAEDRQLQSEFESGISIATICIIHHRTIGSVKKRLQHLEKM